MLHASLLLAALAVGCKTTPVDTPAPTPAPTGRDVTGAAPAATAPQPGPAVITARDKIWTWVPFSEARCADNSPTGIGVNINKGAEDLLIFLRGGGACWDHHTCNKTLPLAVNLDGFNADSFKGLNFGATGIFSRDNPQNPFRGWSYVLVPFCTGDFHGGRRHSKITGKHHLGHTNMAHYLRRLVPTFSGVKRVLLAGTSAGGFGATINYEHVQRAFGDTPVHLLADSSPIFDEAYLKPKLRDAWYARWGLARTLPAGCAACRAGKLHALPGYLARTYPNRRFGLISSRKDLIIRKYWGHGYTPTKLLMPASDFEAGLDQLVDKALAPYKNWRVYYVPGVWHVFLNKVSLRRTEVGGVKLVDWVGALATGGPAWKNVRPAP